MNHWILEAFFKAGPTGLEGASERERRLSGTEDRTGGRGYCHTLQHQAIAD